MIMVTVFLIVIACLARLEMDSVTIYVIMKHASLMVMIAL